MVEPAYRLLRLGRLLAVLLAVLAPARALAQGSDTALAEQLFRDGKRLMGESKFAEACPKFAASYKLDSGLGTLLNLAACHEAEGKSASAWAEFSDAAARARRDGDSDRVAFAEERMRALEPKLARITISVQGGGNVPGLVVKLDNREISSAAFGVAVPVDPGAHQVHASAPGKEPWAQNVQAPAQAANLAVTVPLLRDAPAAAAAPAPAPPPQAAPPPPQAAPSPQPQDAAPARPAGKGRKTAAIIIGVATVASGIGAAVTGVMYSGAKDDFEKADRDQQLDRFSKHDAAQNLGIANAVLMGTTVLGAGITIILLATAPSSSEAPRAASRLELAPVFGPGVGGVSVRGRL